MHVVQIESNQNLEERGQLMEGVEGKSIKI